MKYLRTTTILLTVAFIGLIAMSCRDSEKAQSDAQDNHSDLHVENAGTNHGNGDGHHDNADSEMSHDNMKAQNSDTKQVVENYMTLKDALVETNTDEAAQAGKNLENTLNSFNVSSHTAEQQEELKDIIADAKEHAEHIGKSPIAHQREHFKILSKDIIDMIAITGAETTLYQQFCPMYDNGSAWLSMNKDIKNPYYGSNMLTCGKVQKEIN